MTRNSRRLAGVYSLPYQPLAPTFAARRKASADRGNATLRSKQQNIASGAVPVGPRSRSRPSGASAVTSPSTPLAVSAGRMSIFSTRPSSSAAATTPSVSAGCGGVGRVRDDPHRVAATRSPTSKADSARAPAAARRRRSGASGPPGDGATHRGRCTAHRAEPGRPRTAPPAAACRPRPRDRRLMPGQGRDDQRGARDSCNSTARPDPGSKPASTAVLPPGAAHRSTHRSVATSVAGSDTPASASATN